MGLHTSVLLFGILSQGGNGIWAHNMVPFYNSPYYKVEDTSAYAQGPSVYGESPNPFALSQYKAEYLDGHIVLYQLSEEYVERERIEVEDYPTHISFTFDQNGHPVITWEVDKKDVYIYFYDVSVSSSTVHYVGAGRSPHVIIETFNNILKPVRQVFLVYSTLDDELMLRQQDERYRIDTLIEEDVHAVVTAGHTIKNSTKVVYLKRESGKWTFDNIATERLGEWAGDAASDGRIEFIIDELDVTPVIFTENFRENPVSVIRGAKDIEVSKVDSLTEIMGNRTNPVSVTREAKRLSVSVRSLVYLNEFEESIPNSLDFSIGEGSLSINEVRVDTEQHESIPEGLTFEVGNASFDYWVSRVHLSNYYNQILGLDLNEILYTVDSWAIFSAAMANAEAVLEDDTTPRDLITDTFYELRDARLGLTYRDSGQGDGDPYWDNVVILNRFNELPITSVGNFATNWGNGGSPHLAEGKFSSSIEIINSEDRIFTEAMVTLNLGETYTIEGWAYFKEDVADHSFERAIASQWDYRNSNSLSWILCGGSRGLRNIEFATTDYTAPIVTRNDVFEWDEWVHVAVSVNEGMCKIFVNGVEEAAGEVAPLIENPVFLWIGGYWRENEFPTMGGRVDEFRITRGVARYTSDFVPPTTPFSDHPLVEDGDPYWNNVTSLMHFDGNLIDEVGERSWEVIGEPTFEDREIILDSSNYIQTNVSLGGEPFTLEFFATRMEQTEDGYSSSIMQWGVGADSIDGFSLEYSLGQYSGINYRTSYSSLPKITPEDSNEYERSHIAIVFDGSITRAFFNGIGTIVPNPHNLGKEQILKLGNSEGRWKERRKFKMDEFRLTLGVARYTSDFVPPTKPFPNYPAFDDGDQYWDKVVAFLNFENGMEDPTGREWEAISSPALLSPTGGPFGGPFARFEETPYRSIWPDGKLSLDKEEELTIESFVRVDDFATGQGTQAIVALFENDKSRMTYYHTEGGDKFRIYQNSPELPDDVSYRVILESDFEHNKWVHVAYVRDSNGHRLYFDGEKVVENSVEGISMEEFDIFLGDRGDGNEFLTGDVAHIRITKGVARYVENFDPPTKPFPSHDTMLKRPENLKAFTEYFYRPNVLRAHQYIPIVDGE